MKVTICIGSSCHLKGARQVVEALQSLIAENDLKEKIDLSGALCTGNCRKGVCVTVNGNLCSVSPDTVEEFFRTEILEKL